MATDIQPDIDQLHRFSVDEYHRLIESGGFDEDVRIELIDGLLVTMSPNTEEHEQAIVMLTAWLYASVDLNRYAIGVTGPLTLKTSEPEPDLTVVPLDVPSPAHTIQRPPPRHCDCPR